VTLSNQEINLAFIPPKFVTVQAPNIVISGASYSASEQKTGETWIDGKPIYRRLFTGTITAAVNELYRVSLIPTGISEVIKSDGWWDSGSSGSKFALNCFTNDNLSYSFLITGPTGEVFWKSQSFATRTNSPYKIWIEYTKA
jgi:hypothetical protein